MVVATQVSRGLVFDQQRVQLSQQALCGAVLGHRPHRVVPRHQQEVCLGPLQPLLDPLQLPIGLHGVHWPPRLLVIVVIRVPAQQHCVHHQDGQSAVCAWHTEVQLVVVVGETPEGWGRLRAGWRCGTRGEKYGIANDANLLSRNKSLIIFFFFPKGMVCTI